MVSIDCWGLYRVQGCTEYTSGVGITEGKGLGKV